MPCFVGPCYPCPQTETISCACKGTSVTVPCGREKVTRPPKCNKPCKWVFFLYIVTCQAHPVLVKKKKLEEKGRGNFFSTISCACKGTNVTVPCGREKVTRPPKCNKPCKWVFLYTSIFLEIKRVKSGP